MTPPESPAIPRLGARESNSSKNTTQGAADRALAKTKNFESHDIYHHCDRSNIYLLEHFVHSVRRTC